MSIDNFQTKVLNLVKQIPLSQITTYKILATATGNKYASRAVCNALNKNKNLIKIPCHRVIKSNGHIGNYVLGTNKKELLLKNEGITIKNNKIIDFKKIEYHF